MAKKLNFLIAINVLILILGYVVFRTYAEWNAREWVDGYIASVSDAAAVEVKGVNVNLIDSYINLANIDIIPVRKAGSILPKSIHIDEASFIEADRENSLPRNLHLLMTGVSIDFDSASLIGARLKALGYERLTGTAEIDYTYDPEKAELLIKELKLKIDDMCDITVKTRLSSVDLESTINAGLAGAGRYLEKAGIDDIEMHYKDDSLFSRLIREGAAINGMDVASYRRTIELELKAVLLVAGGALDGASSKAIMEFVKKPRLTKISLSALPSRVVRLGEIDIFKDPLSTAKALSAVISSTDREVEVPSE